jgi:flagellin
MNAYRNYNTNTSALAKNLEKLSSGYKINRAGDDAAGLAISEKMRAQITGLNAAQKNVKDGISLVKTAEGAMQEIQDMLNRMDYLATQSANGTYQDEVDRENLNKEMSALKTEINRIADSANFNGIKLLDGSLDTNIKDADAVTETVTVDPTKENALTFENGKLAEVGQVLGTNTVLHNEALTTGGTSFSVDFHNFKFDAGKGNTMNIKMGDTEITLKATEDHGTLEGADLVNVLAGGANGYEITVNGETVDSLDGMKINGQTMEVKKGDDFDYRLTFTQKDAPATKADEINGAMQVTISGKVEPKKAEFTFKTSDLAGTPAAGDVLTINGKNYVVQDDDIDAADSAKSWENIINNLEKRGDLGDYKISVDGGKVTMQAKEAGKKNVPTVSYKATTAGTATDTATAGAAATAATGTGTVADKITTTNTKFTFNGTEIETSFNGTAITATDIGDTGYQYTVAADGTLAISAKASAGASANGKVHVTVVGGANTAGNDITFAGGKDAVKQSHEFDVTGWNDSNLGDFTGDVGGTTFALNYDKLSAAGERGVDVTDAAGNSLGYIATLDGNKLTFTAKVAGAVNGGNGEPAAAIANGAFKVYNTANIKKLSADDHTIEVLEEGAEGGEMQGITEGAHGDFNVSTTNINNVAAGGADRLASTYFDLTEDMVKDGAQIKIGLDTFTFTTDKKKAETDGYVYAGDDLLTTAKNLTEAAKGNAVWTVGHDGTRITLTETVEHADLADKTNDYEDGPAFEFDLSTKKGIEESLGFIGAGSYTKEEIVSEAVEGGKALNLQIGDTSDEFNQMKVAIGDMHVKAMGTFDKDGKLTKSIDEVDILNPENAAEAVDVIKNAINYVSSVRGDLGAYQNRLEHTANNLSVMAENIQDAESTIRDTDIAEEMMAYTKNNILIQSAQAMLAQANAVPQGVLQLLG